MSEQLIAEAEVISALRERELFVTSTQLHRWHRRGLIPRPVQKGLGRGRGSETRYPTRTIAQAARVAELLAKNRLFEDVGWELWWEGFIVKDEHWRPHLEAAAAALQSVRRLVRLSIERDEARDRSRTLQERIPHQRLNSEPLNLVIQLLPRQDLHILLRILVQTIAGHSDQLEPSWDDQDARDNIIVTKALRLSQAREDRILGRSISVAAQLPNLFKAIAHAISLSPSPSELTPNVLDRISADRAYIRDAFCMISSFYEMSSPIYGHSAFGLRLAAWFTDNPRPKIRATLLLIFSELRAQVDANFYDVDKIRQLRTTAESAAADARKLQKMLSQPHFMHLSDRKKLRHAFSSEARFLTFLHDIRAVAAQNHK